MSESTANVRAYGALVTGVLCIGFSPIFVKLANTTGDVVGFYRLAIATLVMSVPLIVHWRRGNARLPRRILGWGVLAGLFFALDLGVWNTSLTMTTASTATLLGNTAPIWVGLGAWLIFRERLRPAYWLGLVIALCGAALIVGVDSVDTNGAKNTSMVILGNLLAASASVAYAGYQLTTQHTRQHIDNLTYMWLFSGVGAIILLGVSLALGHPLTGLPASSYRALLGLALVTHILGWLLINYAFGYLRASLVSVTLLGQPIVATLAAMPILGEWPGLWHVVGGVVTLAGIYVVHRSSAR
jgi:drug/metabolite transporter (DMT)-like permease